MKLNDNIIRSFRIAQVFHEHTKQINSIDFSFDGDILISSSEDETINVYDCQKGTHLRTLMSKKYGADIIRFTQDRNTAIHSSTKIDDSLRCLSLHDNKYMRYFHGHTQKVTSLYMSPVDDTFISGSHDRSVRIWDLKSPDCVGIMNLPGTRPVVNFDPDGIVFAIGFNSDTVNMYNVKSFDKGPFSTFKLPKSQDCEWTDLKFSPCGRTILISTNGNVVFLIDAFQGTLLETFVTGEQNRGMSLEASFSPEAKYIFSGAAEGRVNVWNAESRRKIIDLCSTQHAVQFVQFNPKYMLFASACNSMSVWLPTA